MTASLPSHPRVPAGRGRTGASDLLVIQRATQLIDDLGADLDRRLTEETRPAERLRLLRETTNRITRTANDAIHAYGRARKALSVQIERSNGSAEDALAMQGRLRSARLDLLRALSDASHRYPAGDDPAEDSTETDGPQGADGG